MFNVTYKETVTYSRPQLEKPISRELAIPKRKKFL